MRRAIPTTRAGLLEIAFEQFSGLPLLNPRTWFKKPSTTLGVVEDVGKGGFDAVGAFKNAISPFKGRNLTNAGRAVTKHPQYFGFESMEALQKVFRSPEEINNLASSRLKDVLRNGNMTTGAGGRYPNGWVTYTLPNGNAASWGLDGSFIGFRGIR